MSVLRKSSSTEGNLEMLGAEVGNWGLKFLSHSLWSTLSSGSDTTVSCKLHVDSQWTVCVHVWYFGLGLSCSILLGKVGGDLKNTFTIRTHACGGCFFFFI